MSLSVTTPIQPALDRTRRILFEPFDTNKWLTLGFCAFLAGLGGRSFGGLSFKDNEFWFNGDALEHGRAWAGHNWPLVVAAGLVLAAVLLALYVALIWLQARGYFMLLDGVVHDRGAVKAPWAEFRRLADSLFRFKLILSAIGGAIGVGVFGSLLVAGQLQDPLRSLLFVCALLTMVTLAFCFLIIDVLLGDFVVPAMYARKLDVRQGWGVVRAELLSPYPGAVCLYLLVRLLIALVSVLIILAAGLATLCVGFCLLALPYVGTVLTLPLIVFVRCYSLKFLEQLGDGWHLQPSQPPHTQAVEPWGSQPSEPRP